MGIDLGIDYQRNEFTDWGRLRRTSVGMAVVGGVGYYKKHRALLKMPPYLE